MTDIFWQQVQTNRKVTQVSLKKTDQGFLLWKIGKYIGLILKRGF